MKKGGPKEPPPPYTVTIEDEAKADLRTFDKKTRQMIGQRLGVLAYPYKAQGVKKIADGYRLRIGDFRAFYVIDDKTRAVAVTNVVRRGPGTYS